MSFQALQPWKTGAAVLAVLAPRQTGRDSGPVLFLEIEMKQGTGVFDCSGKEICVGDWIRPAEGGGSDAREIRSLGLTVQVTGRASTTCVLTKTGFWKRAVPVMLGQLYEAADQGASPKDLTAAQVFGGAPA